jgi:prevent-host-death family protein
MIVTMIMVNINEVKAKLSEYLDAVSRGERVLICNRNRPVAELAPVRQQRTEPRPIGGAKGVVVHQSFFEPLPDSVLDAFEGGGTHRSSAARPPRVEQSGGGYGAAPAKTHRK